VARLEELDGTFEISGLIDEAGFAQNLEVAERAPYPVGAGMEEVLAAVGPSDLARQLHDVLAAR
jgi:hypothetical protein